MFDYPGLGQYGVKPDESAQSYPLPRQVPAAPSALVILGPAIFNALGSLFAPKAGEEA
jgi:hypothetical protein